MQDAIMKERTLVTELTLSEEQGFATRAIHQGYNPSSHQGALVPPVYMTSTPTNEQLRWYDRL
jgi:methionine-gamma-lyase